MERLLHYVWKYKLYASTPLTTTEGLPIAVIDPGIQNTDAGPDLLQRQGKNRRHGMGGKRGDPRKSFRLVAASS